MTDAENAGVGKAAAATTPVPRPETRRLNTPPGPVAGTAAVVDAVLHPPSGRITEKAFQDKVVALARWCGWKCVHFAAALRADGRHYTPVRYDGKGFVDLVLVHPDRHLVWFREVKAAGGRLSPEQIQWRQWLVEAGANWEVWWPQDWDDIVPALSNGRAVAQ